MILFVTISCYCVSMVNGFENNDNNARDALSYPRPDLEPMPEDFRKPYKGVNFGPMGPTRTGVTDNTENTEKSINNNNNDNLGTGHTDGLFTDELSSTTDKPNEEVIKRYPMVSTSFRRVETPFIIGLWIFCASLAKIGE